MLHLLFWLHIKFNYQSFCDEIITSTVHCLNFTFTCMLNLTNRHPFRYRAVAIMFMIGALLMLLTTVAFMIGGNFEKICQTFLDMSILRDVIFSVIVLPTFYFRVLHF